MSIPSEVKTNAIRLEPAGAYVVLLDVRLNDSQTVYLTTNNEPITFDGRTYIPFPMGVPGDEQDANGNPGEIQIAIDNSSGAFDDFLAQNTGLTDRTVVIREGFTHLTGTPSAWKRRELTITNSVINDQAAIFSLGATPVFNIMIPSIRFEREGPCTNIYRGKRCRYRGQTAAISNASDDTPIVIETMAPHGFKDGAVVTISGNAAANGQWVIAVTSATEFELVGSTGTSLAAGGTAFVDLPICDLTRFGPAGCVAHDNILNYRGAPGIQREP
jgi:phage-related protein